MIDRGVIVYNSKSGNQIQNMLLTHQDTSKSLAILFPGGDNSADVPTLHYARKAALLAGCDILSLQYGYSSLNSRETMEDVVKECYEIIEKADTRGYSKIFLICKSVGHFIALQLGDLLKSKEINYICYTPLSANIQDIRELDALVITGTNDKWCSISDSSVLESSRNVELVKIDNATHSLEIDNNYKESIRILEEVTDKCSDYIIKNMFR